MLMAGAPVIPREQPGVSPVPTQAGRTCSSAGTPLPLSGTQTTGPLNLELNQWLSGPKAGTLSSKSS